MSRYLAGLAALTLMGAAALPLPANAGERHDGIANKSIDLSARRCWRGGCFYGRPYYHRRFYVRRYWGPPYYPRYRYGYYGYPYYHHYYRPGPFVSFGVGPFGFVF